MNITYKEKYPSTKDHNRKIFFSFFFLGRLYVFNTAFDCKKTMPAIYSDEPLTEREVQQAADLLREGSMFQQCSLDTVRRIAMSMTRCEFDEGDMIVQEGKPATHMHVIAQGNAMRYHTIGGVDHRMDAHHYGTTISSLHILNREPVFANAKCMDKKCVTYALSSEMLNQHIMSNPVLSREIIESLTKEVRTMTKIMRTPLLEQHPKPLKQLPTISVAAGIESYYRSALNSMINARLTGHKAPLFPHMSVQVPTRVLYINGLKGVRQYLDQNVNPQLYPNPLVAGIAVSVAPGIIMTPVSSVLEATNAGHYNNEKLSTRWIRGLLPRGVREIIFGFGLNQLSDYFEERANSFMSTSEEESALANAVGSVGAGIVAGYLSHVPHNLSTYKLMNPQKSYGTLFRQFADLSAPRYLVPQGLSSSLKPLYTAIIACIFPRGCVIRTAQIVGSFMILNGTINLLQRAAQ